MITLSLPWPPSVNGLYATNFKTKRRFTTAKGNSFLLDVNRICCRVAKGLPILTGRLGYRISLYPPDRRKRDISNVIKSIEDAMTKCGIWKDDSQVDDLRVVRMGPVAGGKSEITIWDLGSECAP